MNKVNPLVFISKGDIVSLNKTGLNYAGLHHLNEKFEVIECDSELDELKDCIKENGIKSAKNCDCWRRWNLKSLRSGEVIKGFLFEEMNIVELKS